MPISAGVCIFQPGSVKIGGTWQLAQLAFPLKIALPRAAMTESNEFVGGFGAAMPSW